MKDQFTTRYARKSFVSLVLTRAREKMRCRGHCVCHLPCLHFWMLWYMNLAARHTLAFARGLCSVARNYKNPSDLIPSIFFRRPSENKGVRCESATIERDHGQLFLHSNFLGSCFCHFHCSVQVRLQRCNVNVATPLVGRFADDHGPTMAWPPSFHLCC